MHIYIYVYMHFHIDVDVTPNYLGNYFGMVLGELFRHTDTCYTHLGQLAKTTWAEEADDLAVLELVVRRCLAPMAHPELYPTVGVLGPKYCAYNGFVGLIPSPNAHWLRNAP